MRTNQIGGTADLFLTTGTVDMTTHSAKQQTDKFTSKAATKTMFDRFQSNRHPAHENSEYQGGRVVSDRQLGISGKPRQQYQECFSFAESFKAPVEGVYMAEGTHNRLLSDHASGSPSFGNIIQKSPHS